MEYISSHLLTLKCYRLVANISATNQLRKFKAKKFLRYDFYQSIIVKSIEFTSECKLRDDISKAYASIYQSFHRSEEHTSELQSRENLVCRLLLEKKNQITS